MNNNILPRGATDRGQLAQQQPQQNQPTAQAPQPADQSGLLYDLSSFDPLQAHALQLTASAGLTNLLVPAPSPNLSHHSTMQQQGEQQQQQQQLRTAAAPHPSQHLQALAQVAHAPQPAQPTAQQHNPFFFLQNGATRSLQPIAPAAPATTATSLVGQTPQNYLLPAGAAPTTALGVAAYQPHILPNGLTAAAAPGMIPNILMSQHFQSVVAGSVQQPQHAPLVPSIQTNKRDAGDSTATTQGPPKRRELAPSVVSSSTNSTDSGGQRAGKSTDNLGFDNPPPTEPPADLESMTPAERRRYERNLREQQRSYRISQQIKELRDVLSESNVPFKPNKYSILLSVVDYIKQLQSRAIMLDSEHQKLITTIRQTNEMVNSGNTPSSNDETETTNTPGASESGSDSDMLFVQGLDYRSVFDQCPAALGIAALDGRILDCNSEFMVVLGFAQDELLKQSLFNLVQNHQDIFRAMAEMLKCAEEAAGVVETPESAAKTSRFWNGPVVSKTHNKLLMNLTLTLDGGGTPKFFSCSVTSA